MKRKSVRSVFSGVLAGTLAVTMLYGTPWQVSAADSIPLTGEQGRKENQPRFNGYRIWDIRDWTPEADEGAEFLRAKVPLQNRNAAYTPTQVNRDLGSEGQIMLMQGDYGNAFVDGMMYNNTFGYHTLNYWQYVDYFSPWHGAASQNTPVDLHDWYYENDPETNRGWEKRYFEFGVLNIPNPAYTNAAHRNGVKSIACLYFDQYYRPGQTINELFAMDEDGTFPVAEKLIEMAEYFGYDGYFFNAEEAVYTEYGNRKKQFLARLADAGLWTQYYDTNSSMNASKAEWLKYDIDGDGELEKIQDSVFVNYGWPGSIDTQLKWIADNGYDPYKQVFYGVENNQGGFSGGHSSAGNIERLYTNEDGTKNLKASVALFTPSDHYQRGLDGTKLQNTNYQWMIAERERMFFSGVKCDPTDTGDQAGYSRPDVEVSNAGGWPGVADFVAERSVIDGSVFYSNFSVGKGVQYYIDGEVSSDEEWSNINIQDILPTWQWWIDAGEGSEKLSADFDYGPKEVRKDKDGADMTLPYTQVGAYEGGNSLVVYGDIDSRNEMHLFKTDLEVKANSKASITFRKTSDDSVSMKLGIILKGDSDEMVALDIADSDAKGGWVTKEVDLSAYAGNNIAALGLIFDGTAEGYQMNIGSIKVTDGSNHTPGAPARFEVSRAFTGDEMIVEWTLGSFDTIDKYEIYKVSGNTKEFLGGSFDDIYYIKSLGKADAVTLELVAVGKDGSKSAPAQLTYDYTRSVSNIQVESEEVEIVVVESAVVKGHITQSKYENELHLSWTNPTAEYESLEIKVTMDDSADAKEWTETVAKGETSAVIPVDRNNGEKYNVAITAAFADGSKGQPMNVTGKVKDTYSDPFVYDGDNIRISGKSFTIWCPESPDWFKLHITLDRTALKFSNKFNAFTTEHAIRAGTMMTSTLPSDSGVLEIVIEDYTGNLSAPYRAYLQNGELLPFDSEIDESMIPDAALREYVKTNIGTTVAQLLEYEGPVDVKGKDVADLTGIGLLGKVTSLDISDTRVSDFTPIAALNGLEELKANNTLIEELGDGLLPDSLKALELSGCSALKQVKPGVLGKLEQLGTLNLSGNTALTDLYLDGVKVEAVDISGNTEITTLVAAGSAIKEIDISEMTKVVTLKLNDADLEKITAANGDLYR